jgi:hypothetical protein
LGRDDPTAKRLENRALDLHAEVVACALRARPGLRSRRSPETPSSPHGATTRGEA